MNKSIENGPLWCVLQEKVLSSESNRHAQANLLHSRNKIGLKYLKPVVH